MAPAPKQRFPVVGFLSPPGWYDPSPVEFAAKCDGDVGTQQNLLAVQTFDYALTSVAACEPEVMIAARSLGAVGCDVVAAVNALAQNPHDAEAIVITGAGCRTNLNITALEAEAGKPVIGADTALFWAAAKSANIPLKPGALGALTDL